MKPIFFFFFSQFLSFNAADVVRKLGSEVFLFDLPWNHK